MSDVMTHHDVDRGWAWVALACCWVTGALLAAFVSVIGIFQVEFLESFQGSQGLVALVCSITLSSQFLYGPVAGVLSDLVTHRVAIMIGSSLLFVGLLCTSFCQDLSSLVLVFGIVCGLGAGLCYSPAITVVSTYFLKYRTLANGICLAAPGMGILAAPYPVSWLIDNYGWRFAIVCFGCVMAQICVLAAMLFPYSAPSAPSCCAGAPRQTQPSPLDDRGKPRGQSDHPKAGPRDDLRVMEGSGSVQNVSEFGSVMMSQLSVALSLEDIKAENFSQRVLHVLSQKFLWVMFLAQMLVDAGFGIHIILYPAYARSVGLTLTEIPPLFIMYGVTLTVSRLALGFVFTLVTRHWLKTFFCFRLAYAAMLTLIPLCGLSFPSLMVCQVFMGMTYGASYGLLAPIMVRYMGLRDLPLAFGVAMMASGIGSAVGPPIAGVLFDTIGNYRVCFFVAGATVGASALSLALLGFLPNLQPLPEGSVTKDTHLPASHREPLLSTSPGAADSSSPDGVKDSGNDKPKDVIYQVNDGEVLHRLFKDGHG